MIRRMYESADRRDLYVELARLDSVRLRTLVFVLRVDSVLVRALISRVFSDMSTPS